MQWKMRAKTKRTCVKRWIRSRTLTGSPPSNSALFCHAWNHMSVAPGPPYKKVGLRRLPAVALYDISELRAPVREAGFLSLWAKKGWETFQSSPKCSRCWPLGAQKWGFSKYPISVRADSPAGCYSGTPSSSFTCECVSWTTQAVGSSSLPSATYIHFWFRC